MNYSAHLPSWRVMSEVVTRRNPHHEMVPSVWPTRRVWQTLCNTVEKVLRLLLLVGVDDAVVVVGHAYFDVVVVGE
jgi:hypothetical protein